MGRTAGSHRFGIDLQPSDKVVPRVLTRGAESVSVDTQRGPEAEMIVDADMLFDFLDEQSRSLRDFLRQVKDNGLCQD